MRHEMLTQRALFCHHANTKPGTLSQHFVTHVVATSSEGSPLSWVSVGYAAEHAHAQPAIAIKQGGR